MPRRSKRRKSRKHGGGAVSMEIPKPNVSNTSASGAIQGTMNKQKAGNAEVANLNKQFSGGGKDIVVPQMGQAGEDGNKTIMGGVAQTLQGASDAEFDGDVHKPVKSDGLSGGRRRRRRKRKTKRKSRKSRKSKRRRRKKRKTRKKRKSRKRQR